MSEMKYIAFDGEMHQEAVIFASSRSHAEIAALLEIDREDILGAGFVSVHDGQLFCHGVSQGLGTKARPEDTQLVLRMLGS